MKMNKNLSRLRIAAALALPALLQTGLYAITPPTAMTVPFQAAAPTVPHTSWSGNQVTLKGTITGAGVGVDTINYDWDPGDGGSHCSGTVTTTNQFDIECQHTYNGSVGSVFVAVLNATDTTNGTVAPVSNCPLTITKGACYYTSLNNPPPNLSVEVNNAIDNGLWYLHKTMKRTTSTYGAPIGNWYLCNGAEDDSCEAGGTGPDAQDCAAFENSGFLETNTPANPYSADVTLCLAGVFDQLMTVPISTINDVVYGSFNPDSNGNGIAVQHDAYPENYQTGMQMDAIVASGEKTTAVPAGTQLGSEAKGLGSGTGGLYTYQDAVKDMADDYAYCQAPSYSEFASNTPGGGWHYSCQEETGDNSVSQWAAIGLIPARRKFSATIPTETLTADKAWLDSSFTSNTAPPTPNGYFGYTSSSPIWGPYADTPSGLVQLALNGLGRGTTSPGGHALWDSAETYIRDDFGTPASDGAGDAIKAYYYGLFSFTKAMLLHDNSGTGLGSSPITLLQSSDDPGTCAHPVPIGTPGSGTGPCYPPIDWYGAQTSAYGGTDPTQGVARTLVSTQNADGSWFGHNYTGAQYYLETGISITMLNKTVFNAVPVACFTSNPSHVASGGPVKLDGGCSSDQNPANQLVSWEWDVDGTGGTNFTIKPGNAACLNAACSIIIWNFKLPTGESLPYNFPVRLRVTDSGNLTADVVGDVVISNPPNPPNANAGGPYNFCPNDQANTKVPGLLIYEPFILDGSKSTNPDQGKTDGTPGAPPSTITSYLWDYACAGSFNSAAGAQVNATAAFDQAADFGKSFNVCLQVTNNDNLAFPTAGLTAGLSSVAAAQVTIHNPTDEMCTHCVQTLGANAKAPVPGVPGNIQLYWIDTNTSTQFTIDHYNIYRSLNANFTPSTQIAGAASSPFVPAVQVSNPPGGKLYFLDPNVVGGTTYYYRVAPATASDAETCQSNVTLAVALSKGR
jgi:hypothetical protein